MVAVSWIEGDLDGSATSCKALNLRHFDYF